MKWCRGCESHLPLESFAIQRRSKSGRQSRCRECHGKMVKRSASRRMVWHECTLCGDDRLIDSRNVHDSRICDKCQRDNVRELNAVRRHLREPARREQAAWSRARRYSRDVIRDLTRVHKRVGRELQWIEVRKPRVCPSCESSFTTDSWTKVYCSELCAGRSFKTSAESKYGRFRVSRSRREAIYARDEWLCFCGDPVIPWGSSDDPYDARYATLDHIQPRSLGGSDEDGNLRTAHFGCNSERGADPNWELELAA